MTENVDYYGHRLAAVNSDNPVTARENIYNEQDALVLAKGKRLSVSQAEIIAKHKLIKPLEHSIDLSDSLEAQELFNIFEECISTLPCLSTISENQKVRNIIMQQCLFYEQFPLLRQKLTVLANQLEDIFYNSLYSAALGLLLAIELELSIEDQQAIFIGGLMHDTGFLHLTPDLTSQENELERDESLQTQVHPIIAKEFLRQVPNLPKYIGDIVEDHHERTDGTGYPKNKFGPNLTVASQVLAYTDKIASTYKRCEPYGDYVHQLTMTILQLNSAVHLESVYKATIKLIKLNPAPSSPPPLPPAAKEVMVQHERITKTFDAAKKLGFVLMKNTRSRLTRSIASMLGHLATSVISSGLSQEEYHDWLQTLCIEENQDEHLNLLKSAIIQDEIEEQLERFKLIMWKTIKKIPEDQTDLINSSIKSFNQIDQLKKKINSK